MLEERAITAGTVTRHGLQAMLDSTVSKAMEESGMKEAIDALSGQRANLSSQADDPSEARLDDNAAHRGEGIQTTLFTWGGKQSRVRQNFQFPKGTPLTAWQHYLCGNGELGYPPYKFLEPKDMPNRNLGEVLGDYKYLMRKIAQTVGDMPSGQITVAEANNLFYQGIATMPITVPMTTEQGRDRRGGQLGWRWVSLLLRKEINH